MNRGKIMTGLTLCGAFALLICGSLTIGETQSRYVSAAASPFKYIIPPDSTAASGDIIVKEERVTGDVTAGESTETSKNSNEGESKATAPEASGTPQDSDGNSDASEFEDPKVIDSTLIPEFMTEFFSDSPLVLKLDTSRGELRLRFMSGSNKEKPLTDVRYSADMGKTWYKLENISEFTLKEASSDGYIMLDFSASGEISGNEISIYAEDVSGHMYEIQAEKKSGAYIEYDTSLPWLIDNADKNAAEKVVTGYNIANCKVTKKLEYMIKTNDEYAFETASSETLNKLIKSEISTDGEAFRDTFKTAVTETENTENSPPAGQYRVTYTWSFGEITVYEAVIPFFINYQVK